MTNTVTMYRANTYKPEIEAVQVVGRTAKTVTVLDPRWTFKGTEMVQRKRRNDGRYFDTWEACKADAVARQREVVESCKYRVQQERTELGMWESLQEPRP